MHIFSPLYSLYSALHNICWNEVKLKNKSQFSPSCFAVSYFCYRKIELNYEVESKSERKKHAKFSSFSSSSLSIVKLTMTTIDDKVSFPTTQRSAPFYYLENHFSATLLVKCIFRHKTRKRRTSLIIKWFQYHFAWKERINERKSPKQTNKRPNERKSNRTNNANRQSGKRLSDHWTTSHLSAIQVYISRPGRINLFVSIGEQLKKNKIKEKKNNIHSTDWQTTLRTDSIHFILKWSFEYSQFSCSYLVYEFQSKFIPGNKFMFRSDGIAV